MAVFVALLMTIAVFALVGYPLINPGRGEDEWVSTNHRGTEDLMSQRDAAYAAIKELEFEFHLGNLSQRDYEDLRARYRQRAADILRQLDAAEREAAAASKKVRAVGPSRDGGAADEIERAVALLRGQREGNGAGSAARGASRRGKAARGGRASGGVSCPGCGARVRAQDRFCGSCGAELPDKKAPLEGES
jgi:hypothetical protein